MQTISCFQLVHVDVNADLSSRLKGYFWDVWNLFDCLCLLLFILAIILRSIKVKFSKLSMTGNIINVG